MIKIKYLKNEFHIRATLWNYHTWESILNMNVKIKWFLIKKSVWYFVHYLFGHQYHCISTLQNQLWKILVATYVCTHTAYLRSAALIEFGLLCREREEHDKLSTHTTPGGGHHTHYPSQCHIFRKEFSSNPVTLNCQKQICKIQLVLNHWKWQSVWLTVLGVMCWWVILSPTQGQLGQPRQLCNGSRSPHESRSQGFSILRTCYRQFFLILWA